MRVFLYCLAIISVILQSCSTDFEVNAKWKDIPVVYGLLNQNDAVHYVKVGKAFLGPEDAYTMAMKADSLYYDSVSVVLEEYVKSVLTNTIVLDKITSIPKDTFNTMHPEENVIFSYDQNILYQTTYNLQSSALYKLNIYVPSSGKSVTASTALINNFKVSIPQMQIGFSNYDTPFELTWNSVANAKLYEVTLRLHYFEVDKLTYEVTNHYLDWIQSSKVSQGSLGGEDMILSINAVSFFNFIASRLEPNPNVYRVVNEKGLDFMFYVGGDDLYTYIEVNKPSNGLIQEKPAFTNIDNGIGLFSTRFDSKVLGKELSSKTVDSIADGIYTKHLNFVDHNDPLYANQP
ncbi:MAG: hypothetical protein A2033_00080 [Bacteroidetes bacterium GWA2_31_9]|nr:MAG: hypothetical protein A2033_00080 [Bacteroidetes bacterium GWA2_31_9]